MHVIGWAVEGGIGEQEPSTLGRVVFNLVGVNPKLYTHTSLHRRVSKALIRKETDVTPGHTITACSYRGNRNCKHNPSRQAHPHRRRPLPEDMVSAPRLLASLGHPVVLQVAPGHSVFGIERDNHDGFQFSTLDDIRLARSAKADNPRPIAPQIRSQACCLEWKSRKEEEVV